MRHSLNYQEWVAWIPTLQIAPMQGRASAIQLVSLIVQILYFSYWLLYNLYSTSNGIINNCRIVRFHQLYTRILLNTYKKVEKKFSIFLLLPLVSYQLKIQTQ